MSTPATPRPQFQPDIEFDSEEGRTAPQHYLPSDEDQTLRAIEQYEENRWLSNNPPDPAYLEDVKEYLNPYEQALVLEREQSRMEDSFTHGRAAMQGLATGFSNPIAGVQRFFGFDEAADATAKAGVEGWQLEPNQALVNFASEVGGDYAVERITTEMKSRESFSHQLSGGAGQLGSMVIVGTATGGYGVVPQIVGQGYEGLYQRAKGALTEKYAQEEAAKAFRDPNYVGKDSDELLATINREAKDMALRNMPAVIPEIILDRITLKQGGKLLRGLAGTTAGKATSVLAAASSEGASEAITSALQNWMEQREINPDQELTEDLLRDFALGFILGGGMAGGAGFTGGVTDLGLEAIVGDVQSLRRDIYKGLVKEADKGDANAAKMVEDWDNAVSRAASLETSDPIAIASATESVEGPGLSQEAVLKAINKKLKARADSLPAVTVVQRAEDIKDVDIRSQVVEADATVEALVVPGQEIILIASNIRDAKRAEEVFDHESIGHEGVDLVTGEIGKHFYGEVARRYGNTKLGQEIIQKYGSDWEIVGRELVANVAENPDTAPSGLKGAVIKLFHKYKPGVADPDVRGDTQVLKAIALAGEVLTNKRATEALKAEKAPSVNVADEDEARFSIGRTVIRLNTPVHLTSERLREQVTTAVIDSMEASGRDVRGHAGSLVIDESADMSITSDPYGNLKVNTIRSLKPGGGVKGLVALGKHAKENNLAIVGTAESFESVELNTPRLSQERLEALYKRMGATLIRSSSGLPKVVFNEKHLKGPAARFSLGEKRSSFSPRLDSSTEALIRGGSATSVEVLESLSQNAGTPAVRELSKNLKKVIRDAGDKEFRVEISDLDRDNEYAGRTIKEAGKVFERYGIALNQSNDGEGLPAFALRKRHGKREHLVRDGSQGGRVRSSPELAEGQSGATYYDFFNSLDTDGLGIQEVKAHWDRLRRLEDHWGPEGPRTRKRPDGTYWDRPPGAAGLYNNVRDVATLLDVGQNEQTLIHELLHGLTSRKLNKWVRRSGTGKDIRSRNITLSGIESVIDNAKAPKAIRDLAKAFKTASDRLTRVREKGRYEKSIKDIYTEGSKYSFANLDEFLVAAFTDLDLQRILQDIPAGDKRSVWQALVDSVKSLLGLNSKADGTLLDEVLRTSATIIASGRPPVYGKNLFGEDQLTPPSSEQIRFSKAGMLKKGVTQDKLGNIYFEGQPPSEWDADQFTRFGKAYGVENFGGLSPIKTITDPETGKPVRLPGGTEGTFSYYEMLWIKANQTPIENIGEQLHGQITSKLARSLMPKKIDDMELVNRLMFGMLSPNAPLLPNEFAQARLKFRNKAELKAFADLLSSYPSKGTKAQQNAWNKKLKAKYGIGSRLDGHIGIGITQKLSNVANMARLFLKNPKFFYKKDGEEWGTYVDRVATQVPGFGTKTASFGGVWQDPANAMISAIDRHMALQFGETVAQDPQLKARFGKALSDKFNSELSKAKKERASYQRRKRKAGDDTKKLMRIEEDWAEKLETLVDPSLKKAKNLDDVMAQAAATDPEKFAKSLGQAALSAMSAKTPKFRVNRKTHSLEYKGKEISTTSAKALEAELYATGDFSSKKAVTEYRKANAKEEAYTEVNPSVRPELQLAEWIEEPGKFKVMSEAYAEALKANESKADELGIPVFPAQWTLWDRIRQRVEPHEVMFPGLHKLPKMGRNQIQESMEVQKTLGYDRAPRPITDSGNVDPSRLVYFSKGDPDPMTGESKFGARIKADAQFPEAIRKGLDSTYDIQTHQEVLEKVQPWFDQHSDDYVKMAEKVMDLEDPTLEPEERVLVAMRTLKGLSALADSKRASSAGREKFIKEAESLEDTAIHLATKLSEFGRTMGRAVSMFQEFGELSAFGLQRFARRQITATSGANLKRSRKLGGGWKGFADEVTGLVEAVRKAGLGRIDNQFFIERLTSMFGGKVPGNLNLWGRYSRSAANRIWSAVQREVNGPNARMKPSLEKFTDALTREIQDQIGVTNPKAPRVNRNKWEDLKEALHNPEKYKDVWAGVAKKVYDDLQSANPLVTQEELTELQDLLGDFRFDPSGKMLQITVKEEMAALQQNINELVREHYSTRDASKASLVKSLMDKLELSSADAGRIAAEISKTYDKTLATEARKQLDAIKDKYTNPKKQKAIKTMERRIVELANLGAFDQADVYNAVAKHVGIKGSYDPAFAAKIKALSEAVQKAPTGFQKNDAISDLFTAIQNHAGDGIVAAILAIRIANLVSGPSTQLINITGNLTTLIPLTLSQIIRARGNPNMIYSMGINMLRGAVKGGKEGASVLWTGKGRAGYELNKHGFDPYLERKTFKGGIINPYNWLKGVFRSMSAMDLLFRFTQTEFKAAFLAGQEAKQRGLKGKAMREWIDEALGYTESFRLGAEAQASKEGLTGLRFKRRVDEIMESNRSKEIVEGSQHYGLVSTYQNVPEGIVGALASAFAQAAHPHVAPGTQLTAAKKGLSVISQTFVPFIRVVANVQNMVIDFTPVAGHVRAFAHSKGSHKLLTKAPDKTPDMIYDMHTRAFIAEAMTAALAAMLWGGDEEDEERLFNVTAAGPKDPAKNKVWREAGNKPYTLTINGKQFGYKETPFGGLLAVLGGIRDAEKYGGEDFVPNLKGYALGAAQAYAQLMFDQAFFKGVKDFMDIAQADNFAGVSIENFAKNQVKGVLIPNFFNQIDRAMDPTKYTESDLDGILSTALPWVRLTGHPSLDVWGRTTRYTSEDMPASLFSRVMEDYKPDPLATFLFSHDIYPAKAKRNQAVRPNDDELSDRERAEDIYLYSEIRGRWMRNELATGLNQGEVDMKNTAEVKAFYNAVSSNAATRAKGMVSDMSRAEVREQLKRIKSNKPD